jgi:hypothetical protein
MPACEQDSFDHIARQAIIDAPAGSGRHEEVGATRLRDDAVGCLAGSQIESTQLVRCPERRQPRGQSARNGIAFITRHFRDVGQHFRGRTPAVKGAGNHPVRKDIDVQAAEMPV